MNTILTKTRKYGSYSSLPALCLLGGAALSAACSSARFEPMEPAASGGTTQGSGGAASDGGNVEGGGRGSGGAGGASAATGGSGGTFGEDGGAGEASAGGASEAEGGAAPECVRDADCVALTCNGEPRCNEGRCDPGLPCDNPDPDHCTVSCVRGEGRAACVPQGLDDDGDGHFDAVCESGGGDDCDDTNATTYAGADEQCDGVDNDCNGRTDVDDGLGLAGAPTLVHEITGTASLGMAASDRGYAILELVRPAAKLSSAAAENLVFWTREGERAGVQPLDGTFNDEPIIHYDPSGDHLLYEGSGVGAEPAFLQKWRWPSAGYVDFEAKEEMSQADVTGRALRVGVGSIVYTTRATPSRQASIAESDFVRGTDGSLEYKHAVDAPAELYRPAAAGSAFTWVQSSGPTSAAHQLTVRFGLTQGDGKLGVPKILHAVDVTPDGTYYGSMRYEALRPQMVTTGGGYVVGWMSDAGLLFARFGLDGRESCRSDPEPGLASWGWNRSMIWPSDIFAPTADVLVVAVNAAREPVVARVDDRCRISTTMRLSEDGAKVAYGSGLAPGGKPFLEVGHPVIAGWGGISYGVAWVDEPKANGLHRVMFRSFTHRLCK